VRRPRWRGAISVCLAQTLITGSSAGPPIADDSGGGGGGDGSGAQAHFPQPVVENVYKAWKPVDNGHPLRDATMYYSPPSLERVKLAKDRTERFVFSVSNL